MIIKLTEITNVHEGKYDPKQVIINSDHIIKIQPYTISDVKCSWITLSGNTNVLFVLEDLETIYSLINNNRKLLKG